MSILGKKRERTSPIAYMNFANIIKWEEGMDCSYCGHIKEAPIFYLWLRVSDEEEREICPRCLIKAFDKILKE